MYIGFFCFGWFSIGVWVFYGLGIENDSLLVFVVMIIGSVVGGGNSLWGSGFLFMVY